MERLQNVEKNLQAIEETEWLKEYLEHFPDADREAQKHHIHYNERIP